MTLRLAVAFPIGEANLLHSSLPEDDHPAWAVGTSYLLEAQVMRDHWRYECIQAHQGQDPAGDTLQQYWIRLGATNQWRPFDKFITDQAIGEAGVALVYRLNQLQEPVSAVTCFGLAGSEITLTVTDPTDGVVYAKTISLVDTSFVIDAFTYCFEPHRMRSEAVFNEIPPYAQASYEISLTSPDVVPKIGQIVLGREYDIGEALFGTSFGIDDYSTAERDQWGNMEIVERPFAKVVDYRARVPTEQGRRIAIVLEENRAKPVVVFGGEDSDQIGVTVYGKLSDWTISTGDPIESELRLKVEGLT